MKIKIISTRGKSFGSYINYGRTFIEADGTFPITELGNFNDGFTLRNLLIRLGHEVEFETQDAYEDDLLVHRM